MAFSTDRRHAPAGLGPGDRPLSHGSSAQRRARGHRPFPSVPDDLATAEEIALRPGDDRYFGAFIEGRLVGLSMLRGWNEGFDVPSFGIVVDPASHGHGIGSMLTDFTLERVPWLGSERVRLRSTKATTGHTGCMWTGASARSSARRSARRRTRRANRDGQGAHVSGRRELPVAAPVLVGPRARVRDRLPRDDLDLLDRLVRRALRARLRASSAASSTRSRCCNGTVAAAPGAARRSASGPATR